MSKRLLCPTPEHTLAAGERLGRAAFPGTVALLIGDLGAGKTLFARGVGLGLNQKSKVLSPTFVVIQAHTGGRLPLWHADLYRLGDISEIEQLGLDDLMDGDGVTLVEWADRFPSAFPADHLEVRFEEDGDGRLLHLTATGPRHRSLVDVLLG